MHAAGPYVGKTLKYLHVDSYETGADVLGQQPTWSAKFLEEFRKRRGYDPLRYLPAMARRIVDSREISDRFLFDIRMTISDLMIEKFFGRFAELGPCPRRRHSLRDGLRHLSASAIRRPAGRRAMRHDHGRVLVGDRHHVAVLSLLQRDPLGRFTRPYLRPKIVQAESFTAWSHFLEYPAALKPLGDEAFCDGLNRVMFHQYTHQPNEDQPGYQYGAGTHIDRHVTWWNMSKPFSPT